MPNPASLISAFPPKELFDVIAEDNPKRLRVFVDLKNVLTSLFVPDVVQEIVTNTSTLQSMDSTLFQSIVNYTAYWKRFGKLRNIDVQIYICTDIGRSTYHKAIDKEYKKNREIYEFNLSNDVKIKQIRDKNFLLAEQICNKLKGVYFFCLKNLEADFLPYYLLTRYFKEDKDTINIVCSNDKDLYQTLVNTNTYMIYKKRGYKDIVTKETVLNSYCKLNKNSPENQVKYQKLLSNIISEQIPAMMACTGDSGDDVPGVKGISEKSAIKIFSESELVNNLIGNMDELNKRVCDDGGKFFKEDEIGISKLPTQWQKVLRENDLVTRAYKLISFEALSRWLEKTDSTEKMDMVKYIDNVLGKQNINIMNNPNVFITSLQNLEDFQLNEDQLYFLF